MKLALNEEEYLLLELLPAVAKTFLSNQRKAEYEANKAAAPKAAETAKAADNAPVNGPVFNAPMGGTVMEIRVKAGDTVKRGDVVLVYEAMKMENDLASDMEGTVKRVLIGEGDVMATGQPLIEFAGSGETVAPEAEQEVQGSGEVMKAPMGGTVIEFKVKPGDTVKAGDVVLVYEAMKMENNLVSDAMSTDQPIIEFGVAGAKPAAPKPAAPKPAPKPAPAPKAEAPKAEAKCCGVAPVDINRAYAPVEGGTAHAAVLPTGRKDNAAPALRLAEGTTLEINVNPDGGIQIRITTGK